MNEREILEKIMESAQDLRVPETLKPEQIKNEGETVTGPRQQRHVYAFALALRDWLIISSLPASRSLTRRPQAVINPGMPPAA